MTKDEIMRTLRAAYRAYRTKAKAFHPDHLNGERAEWDRLNFAWQNVRRAFARRGYTV